MHRVGYLVLVFRPVLLLVAGLAQAYLFVCFLQAVRASSWSKATRSLAVWSVGFGMAALWAIHTYVVLSRLAWVEPPAAARLLLLYPMVVWNYGSIPSAALLFLVSRIHPRRSRRAPGSAAADPSLGPGVDVRRRAFMQAGIGGLVVGPFAAVAYGTTRARTHYGVTTLSVPFGRSLRVVQLSDIHAGLYMTRDDIRVYVDQVARLEPDLLVLTGDFISNSMRFLYGCAEELARLRPRYGSFAVHGNHEHMYGDPREVEAVFTAQNIVVLNNRHQVIDTGEGPFAVAGIDDLYTGEPDLAAALDGLDAATPTLLLSHRPEIFPQAANRSVGVTLAGHWHGGQIKLSAPGVNLSVAHLMTPYPEGHYRRGSSHLYVSRGIGTVWTPIRLNAPPEVVVAELATSLPGQ